MFRTQVRHRCICLVLIERVALLDLGGFFGGYEYSTRHPRVSVCRRDVCHPPSAVLTAFVIARARSSRHGPAITCTPIGIPSGDVPARTTTAGQPVRLWLGIGGHAIEREVRLHRGAALPVVRRTRRSGRPWNIRSHLGLRIERVSQTITEEVEAQDGDHDRQAWKEDDVRRSEDRTPALSNHGSPFRRGRLRSQAQEA